jgi:hypothetical protein
MNQGIQSIVVDLKYVEVLCKRLLAILPNFDITDKKILPYGLKPHTRSVSWLVEQVIVQQMKYHAKELGIEDVNFELPDTCLHDCEIYSGKKKYYVNVKIHNTSGKENKNDIAAVEKLYFQYTANPKYNLIYACFGISFANIRVNFNADYLAVFSPQFMPIYVNPRNDKIQATYHHEVILRTREKFLDLLKRNSKSITLK